MQGFERNPRTSPHLIFPNQFEREDWPTPTLKKIPGNVISLDLGAADPVSLDVLRMLRQIEQGVGVGDIAELNDSNNAAPGALWLPFNATGTFQVPIAREDALAAAIGRPRIMPLDATIPGVVALVEDLLVEKAQFEIVGWTAVVVTEVGFEGDLRYFKMQPARYLKQNVHHVRGSTLASTLVTDGVFAGPFLVE